MKTLLSRFAVSALVLSGVLSLSAAVPANLQKNKSGATGQLTESFTVGPGKTIYINGGTLDATNAILVGFPNGGPGSSDGKMIFGSGVPSGGVGNDGDVFVRLDGVSGTYQKVAGSWFLKITWITPGDTRLTDPRVPTTHATSHKSGGSDVIRLDELGAPIDVTTNNATTGAHGLMPKLSGNVSDVLKGDGSFGAIAGSGDLSSNTSVSVDGEVAVFSGTNGKIVRRGTSSGVAKLTSGVLGTATAGTDYVAPGGSAGAIDVTTQSVDTSSTKAASTAFVVNQLSASGDGTPGMDGTAARGTSTHGARADHVHPSDTSKATLTAQNAFTFNPSITATALATGSQTAAAGSAYYTTLTSNLTVTGFTGTLVNGSVVTFEFNGCNGTASFTFPTSKRRGDNGATWTTITPPAGDHFFRFQYNLANTTWYFTDTVTGALNLAGGPPVVIGVLPIGNIATGTPDGTKFVADDGTLKVPPGSGSGTLPTNPQTGTSYTYVLGDKSKLITFNNASAQAVTIPLNSSVAFSAGPTDATTIANLSIGNGVVTITPAAGATLNGLTSGITLVKNIPLQIIQTAANTWYSTSAPSIPNQLNAGATAGFVWVDASGNIGTSRSMTGTANRVSITNPTGAAGAPVFDVGNLVRVINRDSFSNVAKTMSAGTTVLEQTGTMSASRTVTLSAANSYTAGERVWVGDVSGSVTMANTIVVARAGSDTIQGAAASLTFGSPYCSLLLESDGTSKWTVVSMVGQSPRQTLTDGATITWTLNALELARGVSQDATVTLGGARTLAWGATPPDRASGTLVVIQDGTGSRTLTLPANSKVISGGSGAITLTATAAAKDILSWVSDGTLTYWTVGKNFN